MIRFKLYLETSLLPVNLVAESYKMKRNFLTINLKDNKKIVYNMNNIKRIELEEI